MDTHIDRDRIRLEVGFDVSTTSSGQKVVSMDFRNSEIPDWLSELAKLNSHIKSPGAFRFTIVAISRLAAVRCKSVLAALMVHDNVLVRKASRFAIPRSSYDGVENVKIWPGWLTDLHVHWGGCCREQHQKIPSPRGCSWLVVNISGSRTG